MTILTPVQTEFMFKLHDLFQELPQEKIDEIIEHMKEELEELDPEALYIIKEEQDRLLKIREEKNRFYEFLNRSEEQFNDIFKSSRIPGLDVESTYAI